MRWIFRRGGGKPACCCDELPGLRHLLPQDIRLGHIGSVPYQMEREGGWHFSYCAGPAEIREKIQAYSHQEYNRPEFTDLAQIEAARRRARDLFARGEMTFQIVPVDETFPRYVRENRGRFAHLVRETSSTCQGRGVGQGRAYSRPSSTQR